MPDRTCGGCGKIVRGGGSKCASCAGFYTPSQTKLAQNNDYFKARSRLFQREGVYKGLATCHWCGCEVDGSTASADHVISVAEGGTHDDDNMVVACKPCNSSRGGKTAHRR